MDDVTLILVVLAAAVGGLAGVAYWLDRRRKPPPVKNPAGPLGRALLWAIRILVGLMVISVIAFFASSSLVFLYVAAGCLVIYLIVGRIYQAIRLAGK